MEHQFVRLLVVGMLIGGLTIGLAAPASGHVVVKPSEVTTASFQTFVVGVPNEKDIATTEVKLLIPDGLNYVSPTQKPGWDVSIVKDSDGKTSEIVWKNGEVAVDMRDEFSFSAQVPANPVKLEWRAYQTYSGGIVVSWDQAADNDGHDDSDTGPFSVTEVVENSSQDLKLAEVSDRVASLDTRASLALYIAIAGVLVGLGAIFVVTRRK